MVPTTLSGIQTYLVHPTPAQSSLHMFCPLTDSHTEPKRWPDFYSGWKIEEFQRLQGHHHPPAVLALKPVFGVQSLKNRRSKFKALFVNQVSSAEFPILWMFTRRPSLGLWVTCPTCQAFSKAFLTVLLTARSTNHSGIHLQLYHLHLRMSCPCPFSLSGALDTG